MWMNLRVWIVDVIAASIRVLFLVRYRISVTGLEQLRGRGGFLILPNHPAEVDPVIVSSQLWKLFRVRPVVLEKYYNLPGVHFILSTIRSIPMPDMDYDSGVYKRRRVERALQTTISALNDNQNVMIYPSGRLMQSTTERIGGQSGVYTIIQAAPEAKIVLVRVRGLYGSIFSRALTGASPDFLKTLKQGAWITIKNLIFFVPKRPVTVEFVPAPPDFPRGSNVLTLNKWLADWYNKPGPQLPTLYSYSCWKEELPQLPPPDEKPLDISDIPPEITNAVLAKISSLVGRPKESIKFEQRLGDDLGLDSLNIAELVIWLNDEYEVTDLELSELGSVGAVVQIAGGRRDQPSSKDKLETPEAWLEKDASRPIPAYQPASSIIEAFLNTAERMGQSAAIADERSGVLTWKRLKLSAVVLAKELGDLPGEKIGIMLPASVGASLTISAVMLSGKTPVMLNWTTGRRNLEQSVEAAGVKVILTSGAFLDRIEADLTFLEKHFVLLEDLKRRLTARKKFAGLLVCRKSTAGLLKYFGLSRVKPDDTAVILFTSGSEAAPKGVVLSHHNIMSNIEAGMRALEFKATDVMLGILPPFHSFGLTVTVIVPLISGLKAAYHANPNESRKIAQACAKWQVTLLAGTPTFVRSILSAGRTENFKHMRGMVTGAEKAPEELFEMVAALSHDVKLLEGYGITECSPIVTVTPLHESRAGVGKPLGGVELLIVNHETFEPMPEGARGLVLIHGPNVFSGYLGGKPNPFVEVDGKNWYNSGDLGYLKQGSLFLAGRLKRFVKIGGEMVSLPAIEEALAQRWLPDKNGPALAVTAREKEDGARPVIYLVTRREISLAEANEVLKAAGISNIARISEVVRVDDIPLLGTGKVDLQRLNEKIGV